MTLSIHRLSLFCIILVACSANTAQAQMKIATVKMSELFQNYAKARENDADFKKRMLGVANEAKAKREAFQKGKDELQKMQGNTGDPAAVAKLKELREMEQTILQFEQKARADADQESRKLRGELLADMQKVIHAKAKAGGYALVINVSAENAAGIPDFLYSSAENDLTNAVLTELNAGRILKDLDLSGIPTEGATPAPKPADKKPEKKK